MIFCFNPLPFANNGLDWEVYISVNKTSTMQSFSVFDVVEAFQWVRYVWLANGTEHFDIFQTATFVSLRKFSEPNKNWQI
jgi:hypothetical protein